MVWLIHLGSFQEVGQKNLFKSLRYVGRNYVNLVLSAFYFDFLEIVADSLLIVFTDVIGVDFHFVAGFHINKAVEPVLEGEVVLKLFVEGVEEDDFVFVVAQVPQGEEQFVEVAAGFQHVAEDDD